MPESPDILALIEELEAERDEINVTIAHLRRRAGLPGANGDSRQVVSGDAATGRDAMIVTGRIRPDEFFRLSIADSIRKLLEIMKQPQNPMAIVNGLKAGGVLTNAKNFYANVNTELKRMKARDLVVNTPSGWGLAEWYPNKPKQNDAPKTKKKRRKRAKDAPAKALKDGSMVGTVKQPVAEPKPKGGDAYHQFIGERRKAGRSLAEANQDWKARNG